eukprot:366510-Chlamydomonas_euryale.AAC.15
MGGPAAAGGHLVSAGPLPVYHSAGGGVARRHHRRQSGGNPSTQRHPRGQVAGPRRGCVPFELAAPPAAR